MYTLTIANWKRNLVHYTTDASGIFELASLLERSKRYFVVYGPLGQSMKSEDFGWGPFSFWAKELKKLYD